MNRLSLAHGPGDPYRFLNRRRCVHTWSCASTTVFTRAYNQRPRSVWRAPKVIRRETVPLVKICVVPMYPRLREERRNVPFDSKKSPATVLAFDLEFENHNFICLNDFQNAVFPSNRGARFLRVKEYSVKARLHYGVNTIEYNYFLPNEFNANSAEPFTMLVWMCSFSVR